MAWATPPRATTVDVGGERAALPRAVGHGFMRVLRRLADAGQGSPAGRARPRRNGGRQAVPPVSRHWWHSAKSGFAVKYRSPDPGLALLGGQEDTRNAAGDGCCAKGTASEPASWVAPLGISPATVPARGGRSYFRRRRMYVRGNDNARQQVPLQTTVCNIASFKGCHS